MSLISKKALALLPTVALVATLAGTAVSAQSEAPAVERFDGVTIDVITFTGPPIGEPLTRHAPDWEALTGGKVNIVQYPWSDIYQKALTDAATGTNAFTLYTVADPWMVDFASAGYIQDLTDLAPNVPGIQWDDIQKFFVDVASYGGKIYGVPIDGDFLMAYYRTDILGADGTAPPKTWDEYLEVAAKYDGQDLDGDGTPDYGSCIQKARTGVGTWLFNGVLASFVQSQGTGQGMFFGDDMTPLVNNEAMAAALDFWQKSSEYGPPDEASLDQATGRGLFQTGRCALTLDWGDTGVLAIDPENSKVMDKVGSIIMPGSTKVLDRSTGKLVDCDETVCPYAIDGVNHAPFGAFGGWVGIINASADPQKQAAALSYISYVAAPEQSNIDVTIGKTGMNPYRISQVTNFEPWLAAGFSEAAAKDYLGAIEYSLQSPNMVLDLRVAQNNQYTNVIEDTAISQFLAGELTREETMQQIFDGWQALTDQIGREAQAAAYASSLGVTQ